jgi:hypothetical protein
MTHFDTAKIYSSLQVIGVISFVSGLLLHTMTYTKAIPPEKKKRFGIIAVLQMILGATLALWPWMMKIVQQ